MGEKDTARKGIVVELFGEDAPPDGEKVQWRPGVVATIRPAPAEFSRRLRRKYAAGLSDKKAEAGRMDASEAMVREHAMYVLIDVEGWTFKSKSGELCARLGEVLGVAVQPEQEVSLDGKWGDKLKDLIFRFAPKFAQWCSAEAIKLERLSAEEEDITAGN